MRLDNIYATIPVIIAPVTLTTTGVTESYSAGGNTTLLDWGFVKKANGDIHPNPVKNTPAYPLETGDILYKGSTFLNESNFAVDFLLHDATLPAFIFDKSRTDIWKPEVQASDWFDIDKPHKWHSSELTQQFFYDNIQNAFRYILWTKDFKDIFVYSRAMDKWRLGARIEDDYFFEIINDTKVNARLETCAIEKYVNLYETISEYSEGTNYCINNKY